ncbi:beta-aspartyl-peptidase [Bacillus canaveralius]|uniref:Isoaspartyl dipeptidase n=1 Tax=Bacillus canaveralius TaxID=1403243 RepID=A0A2N5GJB9_9BACI|nr:MULTISPECIES: beta-aspartyl-peptidase [Bacillus]PLR81199.1 beta-aspartyl-peptidase [Bacillus canaveralius]PLR86634.1 beta-aspartyl-peptidase [Bacillus sp. V33-4]PLS00646.1 beta-aspartyl-peptidase [Bacillus canaveralius]RSK51538.1 beta-aspartyl-peptidase [Bacillus canaveralius]
MLTLIKNGEVYAPDYLGKKDILLADKKIGFIEDTIEVPDNFVDIKVIDAEGKIVVPGFIDSHVHIIGGGGEGSYKTRTPEIQLTDATLSGVTTLIGVIGTDGTTRTMASLIAKARGLEEEGITCYVQTGSYQVPVKTLTGKIEDDIILVDKIIGAGEIAIADHRSSQPTVDEMAKIASAARIGGLLSGKAGIVNVHVGDSLDHLNIIEEVVEKTDIPIRQFYPTHINRNPHLFAEGINYAKKGGYVDFTTSSIPKFLEEGEVKCSKGLKRMLDAGVDISQITFTSDGQASLPEFNANGEFTRLKIGKVSTLYKEVRDTVLDEGISLDQAIRVITENPATILKLKEKGTIQEGKDADLVLLTKTDYRIDTVIALGQVMVEKGEPTVKGTFEEDLS